jgi:uncharacterized protein YrzB (UPF0473 family)
MIKTAETSVGALQYDTDEAIMYYTLKEKAEIDIPQVEELYAKLKELTEGKRYVMLVDARTHATSTNEARVFSSKNPAKKNMVAEAILVNNIAVKLAANFYINFHKPSQPTRLFTGREDAVSWLKKMYEASLRTVTEKR